MNTPPIPRWRFGFIAWRWRYLFAAVLLLTTLLGGLHEARRYSRGKEAQVVLEFFPRLSCPAACAQMLPDDLLVEASRKTGFGQGSSPTRLRHMIRIETSRDLSRAAISLKGWSDPDKADFCNAMADMISKRSLASIYDRSNTRWANTAIIVKAQQQLRDAHERVRQLSETAVDKPSRVKLTAAKIAWESRSQELEVALFRDSGTVISCSVSPVRIHQRAVPPAPFGFTSLFEPATRLGIWGSAGILLAWIAIYLAEGLFPRFPPLHPRAVA